MTRKIRSSQIGKRLAAIAVAVAIAAAGTVLIATPAQAKPGPVPIPGPILDRQQIAQAAADECFKDALTPGVAMPANGVCPTGYKPKINGAYVWSGARSGDWAYWGTGANVMCGGGQVFGATKPWADEDTTCQYSASMYAQKYGPQNGDLRPPQIFRANVDTGKVENITPTDPNTVEALDSLTGMRGGTSHNGVVLLFGQKLSKTTPGKIDGLASFAFDGATGKLIDSQVFPQFGGMRVGVEASDGNLYLGMRRSSPFGGLVLKWTGDLAHPLVDAAGNPAFQTVGEFDNEAGYMVEHDGRLFVSGWGFANPTTTPHKGAITNGPSRIWMSPKLKKGGLGTTDASSWQSIFSWSDFDPDPVIGKTVVWGALVSWHGDLYVGSYQLDSSGTSLMAMWNAYNIDRHADPAAITNDVANVGRPLAMFRITNAGKGNGQKVRLLYGDTLMSVYNPTLGVWVKKPNLLKQTAQFGPAGFGNPFNFYSWTWQVFGDKLYMGTFDASGEIGELAPMTQQILGWSDQATAYQHDILGPTLRTTLGGGDLWRMDSPSTPAVPEDLTGYGSKSTYGIRIMIPFPDKGFFYAGTASADNLRTSSVDRGGWRMLKFTPGAPKAPLTLPTIDPAWRGFAVTPAIG